ncbi:TadE/TadG family type IV pilus assembly protein [Sulfitobacter aestuariivivens]|uniref:TadE/TadG family type IV pilus assembly protein n=1 Tax=Sulfitobacter aestuariivivens TaxID=2766981 RepID=UPI00360ACB63
MIRTLTSYLRQFRRDEDGSALVVEFVIFTPLIIGCFLMGVEMGLYSMRHMFLDRGLDLTVRYVRLNTNTPMTHPQLKDMICRNAGFIDDCDTTLRLEMQPLNPRAFAAFDPQPDCIDLSQPVEPERGFTLGSPTS